MPHKSKAKKPEWGSDEAIARFWDIHDLADYWDELEMADDVKFTKPKKKLLSIRIEPIYLRQLKAIARRMGIGYSALIRLWVIDRLRQVSHKVRH